MRSQTAAAPGTIAYVLKSFPRLSETFIASEIYRLEAQGVPLTLFVIKRSTETIQHPIVGAIRSPRVHLPHAATISDTTALAWARQHFGAFAGALRRQALRHPMRFARATFHAAGHAVRARKGQWAFPRRSPLKELFQAAALADAIVESGTVRHIHAHFCHSATTVAWLASIMTGLPLSFTAHAKDVYCEDLNPAGLLDRKLRAARFVVTCTEVNRRHLQARTDTPVHRLYHGLDVGFARLCGAEPVRPRHDGRVRALAVGRLVPKKGFDLFIEACAILRSRGVPLEATLVGEDGEHEPVLRRRIVELGLEPFVRFTGPMSQARLFEEYTRATVFCLPCRVLENGDRDGFPNVVAEAMATGLPVVTTRVSGIPELLDDGVNGIVVEPEDAVAIADAIEALHADPALAERIGGKARVQIRERFDGDASVRALSSLLLEARA